ncbi:hypothetical protein CEK26_000914 [Fusarium fujikuroi]|uniref:Uncharacterized protein n=1 Tax=Fusarium fujikuroi TaxID=5127 RepID=A0A5Q3EAJ8_FUSFU|nr:hypothetical protein CEK27_000914 [Fusarium fujikuroi]QGI76006.1 hypothetical protein CEK25_000912 [Fusarium fujikuroi]QGI89699.1 hypothetical protein CEK26_000914 [Fusarium fujikuroi]VTT58248.1 unnamed protein product [Fusarium fujikuroi]VTT82282.1 unnamed protein product [Fusarium fujikuroi]
MCLDIYHDYQECGHHSSTENRQVRLGSCPNCEASKKKRERRDYGGFTAQQTHGAGASHGRGQLQTTQPTGGHQELRVPERAHQPGAYRQEPRMHMASQSRPSDRVYTSPPGVYIPHHSPAPSQGARQPRRQYSDPHASSSKRERAVRGQQVGNKVIVDKGVPLPPQGQYKTPDTSRSRTVRNSPRRVGSVRDRVDRSHTVSPLTEDERNAPYVEIPSHDEYAGWV